MKKLAAALALLLALVIALVLTCPDKASLYHHLDRVSAVPNGSALERLTGKALQAQARLTARYHDHRLWATAEVHRGGARERYLGIMGLWLQLSSSDDG